MPDPEFSRKAAAVMNSQAVLDAPAQEQWALRDAFASAQSIDDLPEHLRPLMEDALHEKLQEAGQFEARLHPRGRGGRFVRVHFVKSRKPVVLGDVRLELNGIQGKEVDATGAYKTEGDALLSYDIDPWEVSRIEELRDNGPGEKLTRRERLTDGPAREHLDMMYLAGEKTWIGSLTNDEQDALRVYVSADGFQAINKALRSGDPETEKFSYMSGPFRNARGDVTPKTIHVRTISEWAALLDSAMAKAPATDKTLGLFVYRGVRDKHALFGADGPKVGQRITDKAYTSTTTDVEIARNFAESPSEWEPDKAPAPALLEVETPPGVRGAWMASVMQSGFVEFTLPRGQTYEVIGVREELGKEVGTRIPAVEMRLVHPDEPVQMGDPGIVEVPGTTDYEKSDNVMRALGAHEAEGGSSLRPDLYMRHPRSGFEVRDPEKPRTMVVQEPGKPPRVRTTRVNRFGNEETVEGSVRPPEYLFRAVSEEEYQRALKNGYLQSDGRMNLVATEGTVAAFVDPTYYLPGKLASSPHGEHLGRVLRIQYRDSDGWLTDTDGYAKTPQRIPISRVDAAPQFVTTKGMLPSSIIPGREFEHISARPTGVGLEGLHFDDPLPVRAADPGPIDARHVDDLASIYDGFEHGGLHTTVHQKVQVNKPDSTTRTSLTLVEVIGSVFDSTRRDPETGEPFLAGAFSRRSLVNEEGQTVVHHDNLTLKAEYQGRGFATAFNRHAWAEYQRAGVHKVTVDTAAVGGYAWARAGYDFDLEIAGILAPSQMQRMNMIGDEGFTRGYWLNRLRVERLESRASTSFKEERERGQVPDKLWQEFVSKLPTRARLLRYADGDPSALDGTFRTPAEVAAFGREHTWTEEHDRHYLGQTMWLGKRFLLSAHWSGEKLVKPLIEAAAPADLIDAVGQVYDEWVTAGDLHDPPDDTKGDNDLGYWDEVESRLQS